jgi:hypothetical protein
LVSTNGPTSSAQGVAGSRAAALENTTSTPLWRAAIASANAVTAAPSPTPRSA